MRQDIYATAAAIGRTEGRLSPDLCMCARSRARVYGREMAPDSRQTRDEVTERDGKHLLCPRLAPRHAADQRHCHYWVTFRRCSPVHTHTHTQRRYSIYKQG